MERCHPAPARDWGWAVQLYALRSSASWGVGDLADLAALAWWARGTGAGFLLVSPLGAPLPGGRQERSPYFPSSRVFLNPLHARTRGDERLMSRARALNGDRRIDRDAVFRLKSEALEREWRHAPEHPGLDAFRRDRGPILRAFAVFNTSCEELGPMWSEWPDDLQHPRRGGVERVARDRAERVAFHEWLQWRLDAELEAASRVMPLVHDLPVGFDPRGFDGWWWQDLLVPGMHVGAPPDEFNADGQDWAVPPFDPERLAEAGFEPLVTTLHAAMRHGAGVRIDHVMGWSRLWWVPVGRPPTEGSYVRYPLAETLDIVVAESRRSSVFVIGEDLGVVEDGLRERLSERGILGYRVRWFEEDPPSAWPADVLAVATTHDLPTIAGVLSGLDEDVAGVRARLPTAEPDVVAATYRELAASPCRLVAATLEDALGVTERPNRPGTVDAQNWSLALPATLEELAADPRPAAVAQAMRRGRAAPPVG